MTFKLSSIEAQTAWEDYREFLYSLRSDAYNKFLANNPHKNNEEEMKFQHIEAAFKHGFAAAKALEKESQVTSYSPTTNISSVEPKQITRNRTYKQHRTTEQFNKDNLKLVEILMNHNGPMKLETIRKKMRRSGFRHWNNNNAASYMKYAIKSGIGIVKTEHAHYMYDHVLV